MKATTQRIINATRHHNGLSVWQRKELAGNLRNAKRRGRKLTIRPSALLGRDVVIFR